MHRSRGPLSHWNQNLYSAVIPAKAGIQPFQPPHRGVSWIPAFAGMTQSSFYSKNLIPFRFV
ncbi:hypothetical protein EI613_26080 [Azospirillum sp. 412522]|nr:hypothetical protein [Azospirillum sp. 412522]